MEYGLSYNWAKLEVRRVRHEGHVQSPTGSNVKEKDSTVYLGGLLAANGRMGSEFSRRLGAAAADFAQLKVLWQHANVSRVFKLRVYEACVVQKPIYCLHTGYFVKAELRKLNGFHARCLRKVLGIPHAQYSRVSSIEVLAAAGSTCLSTTLLGKQLRLFGDVARKQSGDPMRTAIFDDDDDICLRQTPGARRRGRPRQKWASFVHGHAVLAAGSEALLRDSLLDQSRWVSKVQRYLRTVDASGQGHSAG